MKSNLPASVIYASLFLGAGICQTIDCSNLPTQFTGNEFPTGDFFSNFRNPCYMIPLPVTGSTNTDLNDTYWHFIYTVDPRYQLIVLGSFPNARYFSVTAYDDHSLVSQAILDTNIVPLTASYLNPYQPGIPYASGQQYAVAINFGGTPGTLETGCMMNGYNVEVNPLDATLRHQGMNWNTDPGFFQSAPNPQLHVVDTPQHTNPTATGYAQLRAYVDISLADPGAAPSVIVRDVASGCGYPAAYALQTLQIINPTASVNSALDHAQYQAHQTYNDYLPSFCYGIDPRNAVSWSRIREGGSGPNPYSSYIDGKLPPDLPATLAAAGQVMRMRLRLPVTPPTPCTNGCSRSGNEQVRYTSLSFYTGAGPTLATVADYNFTEDPNGYATLIVDTGAPVPVWITPANGYTYLDLTTFAGYESFQFLDIRQILPAATFACSAQVVPYKTTVYTPMGGLMGDYLPVVDYPLAADLPRRASPLVGPAACGIFPEGLPATLPNCGIHPANRPAIASLPAPAPGQVPIAVQPLPPITIRGQGFGLLPDGLPYTGTSRYMDLADLTQGWSAGYTGDQCNLSVSYWADNRVELVANVSEGDLCPLAVGDQVSVSIWNPQTGDGPATATVTLKPDPDAAPPRP